MPALSRAQDATNTPVAKPRRPRNQCHSSTPCRSTATDRGGHERDDGDGRQAHFRNHVHTKITKDGKPAALSDGVVGERVSGSYKKTADGKLDAVTIYFGGSSRSQEKGRHPKTDRRRGFQSSEGWQAVPPVLYCRFHQLVSPFGFCGVCVGSWDCCRSNRLRAASSAMMNSS